MNSDKQMELETLYAAQLLAEKLKHPIGIYIDFYRIKVDYIYLRTLSHVTLVRLNVFSRFHSET